MKYIRIKLTDELHLYSLYEWTIFVCCNFVLRMYFIRIQLMNLVHLYLKNNRSTRTPVTQKRQKMCTSAEIKPSLVTLSPPSNRYLSQHLQNDHQREKPDHNNKNQFSLVQNYDPKPWSNQQTNTLKKKNILTNS